jgi:hypothetical protein
LAKIVCGVNTFGGSGINSSLTRVDPSSGASNSACTLLLSPFLYRKTWSRPPYKFGNLMHVTHSRFSFASALSSCSLTEV